MDSYHPGVLYVKFAPQVENTLKLADPSKSGPGSMKTGILSVDQVSEQFGVTHGRSILDRLYEISPASLQYQERHREWGFHLWYRLEVPAKTDIIQLVKAYQDLSEVDAAEPLYQIQAVVPDKFHPVILDPPLPRNPDKAVKWVPGDPYYTSYQWSLNNTGQLIGGKYGTVGADISMEEAWAFTTGSPEVIIAVLDDAVDFSHPDLAGASWSGIGYNFADDENFLSPQGNHGTHVGGIIAALSNNTTGIAGVAGGDNGTGGVRLMSCQIFGKGDPGGIDLAMIYAADNGAAISQNSWGYKNPGEYNSWVLDAIDYFNAHGGGSVMQGGLTIFAAGNSNDDDQYYPAYYSGAMAVASTDNQDIKAGTSNYGTWIDISAPGASIFSTLTGGSYGFMGGTSMACPHVSAVAGLLLSVAPGKPTAGEITAILLNTTDNHYMANPFYQGELGTGRLNAAAALTELVGGPIPEPVDPPQSLTATAVSSSRINLEWEKNAAGQGVVLAFSTSGTFGTPADGTIYYEGQGLPGGGTVLYRGSGTVSSHTALPSATTHYYKAWSYNEEIRYSPSVTASATTLAVHTIKATAGPHGSISPSGQIEVDHGGSQTFTMTPDPGYEIEDVLVDGISVGPVSSYTFFMVTSKQSISVSFKRTTYVVSASAGSFGDIDPQGDIVVEYGDNILFNMLPDPGYEVEGVFVDGIDVGPVDSYEFTNVMADHWIHVSFDVLSYTILASAGPNGQISPTGNIRVQEGGSQRFDILPDPGYYIEDVVVNGTSAGPVDAYTFENVSDVHTIHASFAIHTYTIEATAGPNGHILPDGTIVVDHGSSHTFQIEPDEGYYVADVLVDGVSVGPVASYTFEGVVSGHSIEARFAIRTFVIQAIAGPNGSVSPDGAVTVEYGAGQAFEISPDTGHYILDVRVNQQSVGPVASYLFEQVTADQVIEAEFAILTYTIEASAGPNGRIEPEGMITVDHGSSQEFLIIPDTGYYILDVLVDGESAGSVSSFLFEEVENVHEIQALFDIITFEIGISAGPNGQTSPGGVLTVDYGGGLTIEFLPDAGYRIADVLVDGGSVGPVDSYTFESVTRDHLVEVVFEPVIYTISATAGQGGRIEPEGTLQATIEDVLHFRMIPEKHFVVTDLLLNGESLGQLEEFVLSGMTAHQVIHAEFGRPVLDLFHKVTFRVDMQYADQYDPESDLVYLTGSMFDWASPGSLPEAQVLGTPKAPQLLEITLELTEGDYEYKYYLNGPEGEEWPGNPARTLRVPEQLLVTDYFGYLSDPTSSFLPDGTPGLLAYPNPAREVLMVEASEPLRLVQLLDAGGRILMASRPDGLSCRLQTGGLPPGLYILRAITASRVHRLNVLILR